MAKLLDSGWADTVYEDDEGRLLKIRDQKGQPPSEDLDAPETPEEKQILDDEEKNSNGNVEPDDLDNEN